MFARPHAIRSLDMLRKRQGVNEECCPADVSTELVCNDNDGSRAHPDGSATEAPASSMDASPNPSCRSSSSPAAAVAQLQAATKTDRSCSSSPRSRTQQRSPHAWVSGFREFRELARHIMMLLSRIPAECIVTADGLDRNMMSAVM